jgi:hypothetical protein
MTGPDHFIHAYERLGVIEEALTRSWRRRIALAFRFPKMKDGGEAKTECRKAGRSGPLRSPS